MILQTKDYLEKSSAQTASKSMPGFARLGFKKQSSLQVDLKTDNGLMIFSKWKLFSIDKKNIGECVRESQKSFNSRNNYLKCSSHSARKFKHLFFYI